MHSLLLLDAVPGEGPRLVVRLAGDVDPPDAPALARLERAALRSGAVHLDLADLGFVGAYFAGWLLDLAARLEARGVPLGAAVIFGTGRQTRVGEETVHALALVHDPEAEGHLGGQPRP